MITSIGQSIEALKEEYGLDRELVIEAMKDAVRAAARKQFKSEYKGGEGIQVDWNDDEGIVEISALKTVVEEVESPTTEISLDEAVEETGDDEIEIGDILAFPLPTEDLGRIAAQTAKQILVQKIREAVREKVYDEYVDRVGELINGLVKRFERGDIIVDLGNNLEAVLPRREQTRGEIWNINERVRVVIVEVNKELRGQQIIVSRASSELLKRLFEMEVPEIYDDTVVIKSAVREPGDRAKIAVSSNEKDVDPVGACVGMKGSRVQSIIKELRGEKIDIIEWSDEPSVFAANALSPAKVSQVRITDINERKMEVIVIEDQLSLAIGKRGQNVRLATRLVGWDIDIISEEILKAEITKKMGQMMASGEAVPITELDGMSPAAAETLAGSGIEDIEALANTSVDKVVEILDTSYDEAQVILDSAKQVVQLKDLKEEDLAAVVSEADQELGLAPEDTPAEPEGDGASLAAAAEEGAPVDAAGVPAASIPLEEADVTAEAAEEAVEDVAEKAEEPAAEESVEESEESAIEETVKEAEEPAVEDTVKEAEEPAEEVSEEETRPAAEAETETLQTEEAVVEEAGVEAPEEVPAAAEEEDAETVKAASGEEEE
ncbi:MAG TPA: transcription termination factor NusA [Aridibacter sp.]|nr:transcription termination factor NusA [Aridibacter sp.]